ncbi:MAG: response regulator [Acidobacteriia bacterium]|nr:response regulator [Terriglobia bacterium]
MCAAFSPSLRELEPDHPKILCVDDSEQFLLICQTILEAGGYRVLTATSALQALDLLQQHSVDMAILDHAMPDMNGLELAQEIKSSIANMPVIMFSSTLRGGETFPFVDSCLSKAEGPVALRNLVGTFLQK